MQRSHGNSRGGAVRAPPGTIYSPEALWRRQSVRPKPLPPLSARGPNDDPAFRDMPVSIEYEFDAHDPLWQKMKAIGSKELDFFLDLIDAGSIRACAAKVPLAVKTVRGRLGRLEDLLGNTLVLRRNDGLRLTDSGLQLMRYSREVRLSRERLQSGQTADETPRALRIAVTEGLGTFWLMPRLVEFHEANQDLRVELLCDMRRVDIEHGDYDIAIQLEAPAVPSTTHTRIGTLHVMPFAADRYLKSFGTPNSVDDWPEHRLVWQEADQVASTLLPFFIGQTNPDKLITITTNSSSAHFRAIATGGGIGLLPTYARAISRKVRPVDIKVHIRREIWCLINPRRVHKPEIALSIAWLKESFSGETYPWFHDRFVHPRDFEGSISSRDVINLFEGYIDGLDTAGDV